MRFKSLIFLAAVLAAALPASADMKIKTRMTVSGHAMDNAVMLKGARQRNETAAAPGYTMVTLYQCDLNRMVQINDRAKTYMIIPLNESSPASANAAAEAPSRSSRPTRSGGTVNVTIHTSDTGQRKQMFGYTARNIKTEMSTDASADSCSGAHDMKMSTDGWYIDFPGMNLGCATGERAAMRMRPEKPECQDKMQFHTTGGARTGFPVLLETTMAGSNGQPMTMKQETVDLQTATLDQALFEIPPGYREAKSQAELMGMPDMAAIMRQAREGSGEESSNSLSRPSTPARDSESGKGKGSGRLRVGLVKFGPASASATVEEAMRAQLAQSIDELEVEAVLLDAASTATREQVEEEAKAKGCQYFVYNEMSAPAAAATAAKPSSKKAFGGMLGKITGTDTTPTSEVVTAAGFNFRLFQIGDSKAHLESAAKPASGDSPNSALENEASDVVIQIRRDVEEHRRGLR